jgi:hypothetical protein
VSNLDTILARLRGDGIGGVQAAGIAGNLQVESGFDPNAYNTKEGALGIAQWEGGRLTALKGYAQAHGTAANDLNTQVDFLVNELHGSESNAYRKLMATSDPGSAAAAFDQYYERSSGASRSTRIANAQAIAGGHPSTGGPAGGSSTSAGGVQQAGFLGIGDGWADSAARIALKFGAGCVAGALVVVGMKSTVGGST